MEPSLRGDLLKPPPKMLSAFDQATWAHIKSGPLPDSVSCFQDYCRKSAKGLAKAQIALIVSKESHFDRNHLRNVHRIAFDEVSTRAGEFRSSLGSFGGHLSAEPFRVTREVELLEAQADFLNAEARSETDILRAAAFSHARFIKIHPFDDGNGRIGRAILFAQLRKTLRIPVDRISEVMRDDRGRYIESLSDSIKTGDLTSGMKFLSDCLVEAHPSRPAIPVPLKNPSPFAIGAPMVPEETGPRPFYDDLIASRNPAYFDGFPPVRSGVAATRAPGVRLHPYSSRVLGFSIQSPAQEKNLAKSSPEPYPLSHD